MPPPFTLTELPRFAVMGVINTTPDSFSDGGRWLDPAAAIDHGRALVAAGAAVLDVGGESTRPGAEPVGAAEELDRVGPVIAALAAEVPVPVSVDTAKADVAEAALRAGATVVNDVTAGRDERMLAVVAAADAGYVAMHMRGEPRTMAEHASYDDVVAEVGDHLGSRVVAARDAGIRADAILADPGIGFAKRAEHNLALLAALDRVAARAGAPLVVGASRKSFLAELAGGLAPDERDEATLATTVAAFRAGAAMVRVHDVEGSVRAARLLDVLERATPDGITPASGVAAA